MRRVLVQGWRFLPHSYGLVNQFQCLELLRQPELAIFHQDVPFTYPEWRHVRGILDPERENLLQQIPPPSQNEPPDITYRIAFPFDFRPASAGRTVLFGTVEWGWVDPKAILGQKPLPEAMRESDATVVVPSNWAREGFIRSGADPNRVAIVPHGADTTIFRPLTSERRKELRTANKWDGNFVFLHLGAMTHNKNIAPLLSAFAAVAMRHPNVKLVLKGLDSLYASQRRFQEAVQSLTQAEIAAIQPRIHFSGAMLPMTMIAELYGAADAYVSPYAGEGFNLPVLEAAACGLPVVCTAGGATDDFTDPRFALPIEAKVFPGPQENYLHLAIRMESLVAQMLRVVEDHEYRAAAKTIGPQWVAEKFTWKHAVDKLLEVLLHE